MSTMASQGFSFPPPPPPPPPTQQHQQAPGYSNTVPSYGHNGYSQRGSHRGSGNFHRGRGRGSMNRGGRGGSQPNNYRNQQGVHGGYSPTSAIQGPSPGSASNYYPGAAHPPGPSYPPVAQTYPHPGAPTFSHTSYDGGYRNVTEGHGNGPAPPYPSQATSSASRGSTGSSPAVVAPPMRWGYDNAGAGGFYPGSTGGNFYNSTPYQPAYGNSQGGSSYKRNGHKRVFSSAFEKPTSTVPRAPAPPAVPSFGVPLPAKPPQPADQRRNPKKKKRKSNQLGLTPKTEEHESSAEEDDVDEEARLAAAGDPTGSLQFTFRGRTSTLKSTAEIQLWIEERKKRFPTKARIEEKKKAQEESRKQREIQREEMRRKQQEAKVKKEHTNIISQEDGGQAVNAMDAARKAKMKADRLRKKLAKEERRLQKAEADAERARLMAEASQRIDNQGDGEKTNIPAAEDSATTDVVRTDADDVVSNYQGVPFVQSTSNPQTGLLTGELITSPTQSDISEVFSSSDSDISSDDEDTGEEDAPAELSSRREGPEQVPPPPREGSTRRKKPCHTFQRKGRCPRGDQCRFSHDVPEEGKARSGTIKAAGTKQPSRRGLFQMLVNQETEARDRQVMQAISWLGSHGLLDEPDGNVPLTSLNEDSSTTATSVLPGFPNVAT